MFKVSETTWHRVGAATGIVPVALLAAGFVIGLEAPLLGRASDATIRSFLIDNSLKLRA